MRSELHTHTYIKTYVNTYTCIQIHTLHTYTHTYIHTYIGVIHTYKRRYIKNIRLTRYQNEKCSSRVGEQQNVIMGWDAVPFGAWPKTFRKHMHAPSSECKNCSRLIKHCGMHLPMYMAANPRSPSFRIWRNFSMFHTYWHNVDSLCQE
jgi:hypothetical protein